MEDLVLDRGAHLAHLRWREVDLTEGTARFGEKGGKAIVKPMPDDLVAILRAARESGDVPARDEDYVVPNRRAASVKRAARSQSSF